MLTGSRLTTSTAARDETEFDDEGMEMETEVGYASLTGKAHHSGNEDRYRILDARVPLVRHSDRGFVFAVMDGVGGAPKGMQAAQLVCDRLTDFYRSDEYENSVAGLVHLLEDANREVDGWGAIPGTDRSLGAAAVTVAWLSPERRLVLLHAGDCTAFRYDGSTVARLTTEHGQGRSIHNFVGVGPNFKLQVVGAQLKLGDMLCLVTDGVTKSCSAEHVKTILDRNADPQVAADQLVMLAKTRGSEDDITALIVELADW